MYNIRDVELLDIVAVDENDSCYYEVNYLVTLKIANDILKFSITIHDLTTIINSLTQAVNNVSTNIRITLMPIAGLYIGGFIDIDKFKVTINITDFSLMNRIYNINITDRPLLNQALERIIEVYYIDILSY